MFEKLGVLGKKGSGKDTVGISHILDPSGNVRDSSNQTTSHYPQRERGQIFEIRPMVFLGL